MNKKTRTQKQITITEHSGEIFPNLSAAQQAAIRPLAIDIIFTLRRLITAGVLVVSDGYISVPKEK